MGSRWQESKAVVGKRWRPGRVVAIMTLGHVWVGLRLTYLVEQALWWDVLVAMTLCASLIGIGSGVMARSWPESLRRRAVQWVGYTALGFFSSVFVLTILREVIVILMEMGGWSSAAWISWSAIAVGGIATAMSVMGFFNAMGPAQVKHVEVGIADLPEELHGFTIAQISDIHVGPFVRRSHVERIVKRVNAVGADVVAITGDLVDGNVEHLREHTEPLGKIKAKDGCMVVLGNHDYYHNAEEWARELRRLGLSVLTNEHRVVHRNGSKVVIAGVTDFTAHKFVPHHASNPRAALDRAPEDASVKILLAHQPRSATQAEGLGYDLQLSGHTHGGQLFPWNYFVRLQQPMVKGLYRRYGMQVYVNTGTGFWGPPKRFPGRAEITRIRLVAA